MQEINMLPQLIVNLFLNIKKIAKNNLYLWGTG